MNYLRVVRNLRFRYIIGLSAIALQRVFTQAKPATMEYRITRPDGQERIIFQKAALRKYDNKKVLSGTVQDVTDRKNRKTRSKNWLCTMH